MDSIKNCKSYDNGICQRNHCFCSEARRAGLYCEINAKSVLKPCGHYQNEVCDCGE